MPYDLAVNGGYLYQPTGGTNYRCQLTSGTGPMSNCVWDNMMNFTITYGVVTCTVANDGSFTNCLDAGSGVGAVPCGVGIH